ncbi:MAG: FtsQ-type POTRA domain-containing protein [Treponema sp.]|nr:FtsQ-type POTRA domain-containing protein [Treponema sp.]
MSDAGYFLDNENYFDENENDFHNEESKSERRFRVIILSLLVVMGILLLGEFVLWRFIKPSLSSPKVTISGYKNMSAEDVAMKLIPMNSRNWFTFDVNVAAGILSSESCIKNVDIVKHFPDKILVNINERVPVAVTYINQKGKSIPMQIDETGVLFSNKNNAIVAQSGIPILSGIPVDNMTDGMRIPAKYKTLINQISQIQNLPQKYFAAVSEICVVPKDSGNYELVLIPSSGHTKVLTDRALNEEALKYMMVVLDVVKQLKPDATAVDMRYGSVSY